MCVLFLFSLSDSLITIACTNHNTNKKGTCWGVQLNLNGSGTGASVPSSAFLGQSLKKLSSKLAHPRTSSGNFKVVAEVDEEKQTSKDKWGGLAFDTSDDQQDITRGKGMVDTLFQAPMGAGTHDPIMTSYDYISTGLRQ